MTGNASYRLANTAVLSVGAVEAPIVATSASFDEQLAATYERLDMRAGMLEELAGVRERRWWPEDVTFADAAAMAGAKALAEAGITPAQIGVMINTSVSRAYLEPSSAVAVHYQLGLPTSCLNFDLANACLGFVNGIQLAGTMIESGQADYALLVDAEGSRFTQETTLRRLAGPDATVEDLKSQFATLTLGSGAAAMVLGRADRHPEGHRVVGGVSRAGTEHHDLCVGDLNLMRTDSKKLFQAGLAWPWRPGGMRPRPASTGPTSTTSWPTRPRSCTSGPWPPRSASTSRGSRSPCRRTGTWARPRSRSPWRSTSTCSPRACGCCCSASARV